MHHTHHSGIAQASHMAHAVHTQIAHITHHTLATHIHHSTHHKCHAHCAHHTSKGLGKAWRGFAPSACSCDALRAAVPAGGRHASAAASTQQHLCVTANNVTMRWANVRARRGRAGHGPAPRRARGHAGTGCAAVRKGEWWEGGGDKVLSTNLHDNCSNCSWGGK